MLVISIMFEKGWWWRWLFVLCTCTRSFRTPVTPLNLTASVMRHSTVFNSVAVADTYTPTRRRDQWARNSAPLSVRGLDLIQSVRQPTSNQMVLVEVAKRVASRKHSRWATPVEVARKTRSNSSTTIVSVRSRPDSPNVTAVVNDGGFLRVFSFPTPVNPTGQTSTRGNAFYSHNSSFADNGRSDMSMMGRMPTRD